MALLGLAAALAGCVSHAPTREDVPPAVERASRAVVRLAAERRGAHPLGGSAVLLPGGRAVTAAHLVTECEGWTLSAPEGVLAEGPPSQAVGLLDVAWLDAVATAPTTTPADAPPTRGQRAWLVGRESGLIETNVVHADPDAPLFSLRDGQDGDSGGGVFDAEGRLLGVVVLSGDLTLAVSVPWIERHDDAAIPGEATGLDANLLWGVVASRKGLWEDAARLLRVARSEAPGDAFVAFLLGRALLGTGDAAGAEECFLTVVALSPGDARAWHDLGAAHQAQGRQVQAVECYRRALRLRPSDWETRLALRRALGS